MTISLQEAGAGKVGFNIDGSIDINCYKALGAKYEGGMQVIYMVE
jgi:hypothetical protein